MFEGLKQAFEEQKKKRMLKRAIGILSRLDYEVIDKDTSSGVCAFSLDEESVGLFMADTSTLGSRLEATVLFTAELGNLKLMSDLANIALTYKCSLSGLAPSSGPKSKLELVHYLGERLNRRVIALGLSYLEQCVDAIAERLIDKVEATQLYKFDLSMFEGGHIPFFDPQLIGERKEFGFGDWDQYIQMAANKKALESYTAVEIDQNLDIVLACRDFEHVNNCSLAEVGGIVMAELARHRNNAAKPEDKKQVQ